MFQKLFQFSRRPFIRNVATVASGTAVSQAIAMAFSPLITRLYGPETYGIQAVFMTIAGIMGAVAAMTYPSAIVLPKKDADAAGLARLSMYIGLAASLVTALVLFYFGEGILNFLNAGEISAFMYLIPVFMLTTVASAVISQWLIRIKAFALTAKVMVGQSLFINIIKVGMGFVHPSAGVLIATNSMSGLLNAAMMLLGLRRMRTEARAGPTAFKLNSRVWKLAKRHRDFPLFRAPQVLLNVISHSFPIVMLATYFGAASVGFYSIAATVLAMPAGLIGNSVMQVFYPRINEAIYRRENVKSLIIKATLGLALSGVIPFFIVISSGPAIFSFVFGSEWRPAGVYAQWLSFWLFFQYINRPAIAAIPALKLQKSLLIYEVFSTGTKVLALYIGYEFFNSDIAAIALFSIFGVVAYTALILWVIFHSGKLTPAWSG